jgi:nitrate reductase gamma subunit
MFLQMDPSKNIVTNVVLVLFILFLVIALPIILRARRMAAELAPMVRKEPTNHPLVFIIMFAVASAIAYGLKIGWEENLPVLNTFSFLVLPYLALVIFLVGSIYRYTSSGFQVSSLSSGFLERKRLFWGSQPFHYGLLFLFFGHLIAFLFPASVLAWNGSPVRLMILEMSAFAFGLAALLGLVLLMRRRFSSPRVLMVTNKMDMLVYVVLLVQIITGLAVAYFDRWGSSWFASTLTPYLRSLFALNPDIAAVSAMPWTVKLHIFSAFFIIAIIPFTRFMHFLVAPIDYLWRGYQLVIWNSNRRHIRNARAWHMGHRTRNH